MKSDKEFIKMYLDDLSNEELHILTYLVNCMISKKELYKMNISNKDKVDRTINAIDLVIELIKQQPTEDDSWILDRLNGFKIILEDKEV